MTESPIYPCRCCGYDLGVDYWPKGSPSFGICPCCGCEAGLDDENLETLREYRQEWLATGPTWWDANLPEEEQEKQIAELAGLMHMEQPSKVSSLPPLNWDYKEQMKNIPPQFL